MLTNYILAAMRKARYERIDDGIYGEIPGFNGVYAVAETREACEAELREVLEEWITIKLSRGETLPRVDNEELTVRLVPESM